MNKRKYVCITCLLIFIHFSILNECIAADPSCYWGTWKSREGKIDVVISIKEYNIKIKINNKIFNNVKFEYLWGAGGASTIPFLYIWTVEEGAGDRFKYYEHCFYLILGPERIKKNDEGEIIIKGFYEFNKVLNNEYEEAETEYYSMEFIRIEE